MSLNEEDDEGNPNQLAFPKKIQDELIYVIHTSLNNIATQVNNLNKYAEDLFGELSEEIDKGCLRLKALQERVIYLTDGVLYKDTYEGLSSKTTGSKQTFGSKIIQMQQVQSARPFPGKKCETRDVSIQTSLLNIPDSQYQDDMKSLKISTDASYCFEICEEEITLESKEQNWGKLKKKKNDTAHLNEPQGESEHQLMEAAISVDRITTAFGEAPHLCTDQSEVSSSPSNFLFTEISRLLTKAVGKVLSSPQQLPKHGAGDLNNSFNCVNYGTGVGEALQPQPRPRLKTEVFVSPTAPNSPPPLPPDWLSTLRSSKRENPSPIIHFPTQLPLHSLRTPAANTPAEALKTFPQSSLPISTHNVDICPLVCKPLPYHQLPPDNLLSHGEDQEMLTPLSPPATLSNPQLRAPVTDVVDSTTAVQSPRLLDFQSSKSSLTQPSRSLAAKSCRSSLLSTTGSSLLPSPRFPLTPLPRFPTPQIAQSSVPQSLISACPPKAQFSPPRCSVTYVPRCSVVPSSRYLDVQSSKYSVAQPLKDSFVPPSRNLVPRPFSSVVESQMHSGAQSAGHWIPPQLFSSLKPSKSFPVQSYFSSVQSPSCISSPQTLSVSESSSAPLSSELKLSPSSVTKMTEARSALMETIRKGIIPQIKISANQNKKMQIPKIE